MCVYVKQACKSYTHMYLWILLKARTVADLCSQNDLSTIRLGRGVALLGNIHVTLSRIACTPAHTKPAKHYIKHCLSQLFVPTNVKF